MEKESNNKYNFEEAWRKALSDKKKVPDDALWANIEAALPPQKAAWKRLLPWLAVTLLLVLGAIYFFIKSPENILSIETKNISRKSTKTTESDALPTLHQKEIPKTAQAKDLGNAEKDTFTPILPQTQTDAATDILFPLATSNTVLPSYHPLDSTKSLNPDNQIVKVGFEKRNSIVDSASFVVLSKAIPMPAHTEELNVKTPPTRFDAIAAEVLSAKPDRHWWTVHFGVAQVNSHLQNNYQSYLLDYMKAHQHEMFETRNFFEQSQEQLSNTQGYQVGLELGTWLGPKFYLQGGVAYHFWQFERQSNNFYKNEADGTQHDFMLDMLKDNISAPDFIHALQAHSIYRDYLQGAAPSDLHLAQFNAENAEAVLRSRYHFLNIPAKLGYQRQFTSRLKLNFELGVAMNYFLRNTNDSKTLQNLQDFNPKKRGDLSQIHFNWSAGAFAEYALKSRLSTIVGVEYQRALGTITKDSKSYTQIQPESIGLRLGLRYYWR